MSDQNVDIEHFSQKFQICEEQIREAVQLVGANSEKLEQYFNDKQMKQSIGGQSQSFGDRDPSL